MTIEKKLTNLKFNVCNACIGPAWLLHGVVLNMQWLSNFPVAKKEINKKCRINEQFTGTENTNTCFVYEREEKENDVCRCNDHFDWMDGKCLKSMM